jgi:hypothetical protein
VAYAVIGFGDAGQALASAFARKDIELAVAGRRTGRSAIFRRRRQGIRPCSAKAVRWFRRGRSRAPLTVQALVKPTRRQHRSRCSTSPGQIAQLIRKDCIT